MTQQAQAKRLAPQQRPVVLTQAQSLDRARLAYLQSSNRLDLVKLSQACAGVDDSGPIAGKVPKTK